jgi:hypothetical protein
MDRRRRTIVQRDTPQRDLAEQVEKESIYVLDGGDVFVKCSNCDAPLAECWITRPEMKIKSRIVADCPHCGDKSFITEVAGKFHLGQTEFTAIVDQKLEMEYEDEVLVQHIHLLTEKGDKPYE